MFRFSLREMLVIVALASVSVASMKYVTPAWRTAVFSITITAFMLGAVCAFVDRGRRQAFAIGFALVMAIYAAMVLFGTSDRGGGSREFDLRTGRLPTTELIARIAGEPTATSIYYDENNQLIPNFDPQNPPAGVQVAYSRVEIFPHPIRLLEIAHCWFALLFGYVGGHFARFIYLRRTNDGPASPPAATGL
jgi:hypothetical protein